MNQENLALNLPDRRRGMRGVLLQARYRLLPTVLLATLLGAVSAPVSAAKNLKEAFSESDFGYSFRWRMKPVDQDFSAQSGSGAYGSEIDASIGRKFKQRFGILFKAAFFNSDSLAFGDTNKLQIELAGKFTICAATNLRKLHNHPIFHKCRLGVRVR